MSNRSGNGNLIPFTSDQDREKAAENGRKGGKASGVAKRAKKNMAEIAMCLLTADLTPQQAKKIKAMGLNPEEFTQWTNCIVGLMSATAREGNVKAFEKLQEITGESVASSTAEERKQADMLSAIREAVKGGASSDD